MRKKKICVVAPRLKKVEKVQAAVELLHSAEK